MENQRLFLYAALGFIMLLIWQAWMQEQLILNPPPAVVTTTSDGVPTTAVSTDGQEVPSFNPSGTSSAAPTAAAIASGDRVKVITDVFDIEIDTQGGDLRKLGLRTHLKDLNGDEPFPLMQDKAGEVFIAQSGLQAGALPAPSHQARFTSASNEYRLKEGDDSISVDLNWSEGGMNVTKTYTFKRGSFEIGLNQKVENGTGEAWQGSQYRQIQRSEAGGGGGIGTVYTFTGGVISTEEEPYEKLSFGDMADVDLKKQVKGGWLAMIQHYFLAAWVPNAGESNLFYSDAVGGNRYVLGMVSEPMSIEAGASGEFTSRLYAGPKIQKNLKDLAPHLELTVDYGILTIIAQPLFWLLDKIHGIVGNWGWSIIFLTMLIKAAFFKLSEASYKSMANMRRMSPELAKIKERHGSDRQKQQQAMMELYKKEKINPLGGCLPILVQIPVFIALYWMLLETVEMRHAPFMLWIQDLSAKDPYYILPLIMGASMYIQQKLNPAPPDPIQAKVMQFLPVVFTIFFLWFPAGLVLYWVVNNVLSISQQYVITKRIENAAKPA